MSVLRLAKLAPRLHEILRKLLGLPQPARQFIFLTGLSGSGKSTISRSLSDRLLAIELDPVLIKAHELLCKLTSPTDPFKYSFWSQFLKDEHNRKQFSQFVYKEIKKQLKASSHDTTLIVGNHFLIPNFSPCIEDSVKGLSSKTPVKLALQVPIQLIMEQRRKRGNTYDLEISQRQIETEESLMFNSLTTEGFKFASRDECLDQIEQNLELRSL